MLREAVHHPELSSDGLPATEALPVLGQEDEAPSVAVVGDLDAERGRVHPHLEPEVVSRISRAGDRDAVVGRWVCVELREQGREDLVGGGRGREA